MAMVARVERGLPNRRFKLGRGRLPRKRGSRIPLFPKRNPSRRNMTRRKGVSTNRSRIKKSYLSWPEAKLRMSQKDTVVHRTCIPARVVTTLPYSDIINIQKQAQETFTYCEYRFSMNDIYNCDIDGTNDHSARGYSQWYGLYATSLVHGCKFDLQFYPTSSSTTNTVAANMIVGYFLGPPGYSIQFHDIWDLLEVEKSKWFKHCYMTRTNAYTAASATPATNGANSGHFSGYFNLRKGFNYFGMCDYKTGTVPTFPASYTGTVQNSPNQNWELCLFAVSLPEQNQTSSGVLPLPAVDVIVNLSYDVEFFEPYNLGLALKAPGDGATGGYFLSEGNTGIQGGGETGYQYPDLPDGTKVTS